MCTTPNRALITRSPGDSSPAAIQPDGVANGCSGVTTNVSRSVCRCTSCRACRWTVPPTRWETSGGADESRLARSFTPQPNSMQSTSAIARLWNLTLAWCPARKRGAPRSFRPSTRRAEAARGGPSSGSLHESLHHPNIRRRLVQAASQWFSSRRRSEKSSRALHLAASPGVAHQLRGFLRYRRVRGRRWAFPSHARW